MAKKNDDSIDDLANALDVKRLATSVIKISNAMGVLLSAPDGLTMRGLVILLEDATVGVGKKDIEKILKALPQLKKLYTNHV